MTIHIVCRDCDFEALEEDRSEADRLVDTHVDETGHNVDDDRVDGGAKIVTDSGKKLTDDERTEKAPGDIVSVTTPIYSHGEIKTELFVGELDNSDDGTEFSVEVHQDGPDIALSAGTASSEREKKLYTYHDLTPAKARRIAEALLDAADSAEAADRSTVDDPDDGGDSLLRRLMDQ